MEDVGARLVLQGEAAFLSGMQKAAAVGTAFGMAIYNASIAAGKALIDFAGSSITAASDLNETVSKSQVVFGKYGNWIVEWGKTSAATMGMSTNVAIGAASTYGNLFRSMGMGEKASFDMSTGIVKLSADLASFNNLAPEDVLEKLRAGLTGETEPLKSLGVNLNAATVEAKAMKMGLMKVGGELTASAKAQATYALILEQTSLAQGDFANTSNGLANQQRIFAANLENTKAVLGTALLPIINKVMNAVNKLFSSTEFQAGVQAVIDGVGKVTKFLGVLYDDIAGGDFGVAFDDFREGLYSLFPPEAEAAITSFNTVLYTVVTTAQTVIAWLQTTIQSGLAIISAFWTQNGAAITATVLAMWAKVQTVFDAGKTFVMTLVSWLTVNITRLWDEHGAQVLATVDLLWQGIQNVFNTVTGVITGIFNTFTALLMGDWEGVKTNLLATWDALWSGIKTAAELAWAGLSVWFGGVVQSILDFFNNTDWGQVGRNIINGIWSALSNGWGWLIGQIQSLAQRLLDAALGGLNAGNVKIGGNGAIIPQFEKQQNDLLGAQSNRAERMMMPSTVSAGPSNYSYSYQNNYNLNLSTQQSSASVQQSFAIMRLLAG